jgi:xanthine dehydrogenase accessory factor
VYEIASSVAACLRADTRVDVAWVFQTRGFSSRERAEALAITPGGGRVGVLMGGSLDDQVTELVGSGISRRVVDLDVGEADALAAGLSCGGSARCLIMPATDLPSELWQRLSDRQPVCLVTRLDGDEALATAMFTPDMVAAAGDDAARLFRRGVTDTAVVADTVVTALWPVPKLVIVGAGAIAEALEAMANVLGWRTVIGDGAAGTAMADLAVVDNVVVISHDLDIGGSALAAALSGSAGYIGAIGSRGTQQARAGWLADRGITDLSRIHGPAGLDVGAGTPPEIAVSIIAEALAAKSGRRPVSLRERTGPIHKSPSPAN